MKKILVVIVLIMTCISMSGFSYSVVSAIDHNIRRDSPNVAITEKTSSTPMDQLKKSVYSYLSTTENLVF